MGSVHTVLKISIQSQNYCGFRNRSYNRIMKMEISETEYAALLVLKNTGQNVLDVAIMASEALKIGHGKLQRTRKCLELGGRELQKMEKTVSFQKAVDAALQERADRRPRTIYDFRYITRRLMKRCPGLAARRVRHIQPYECSMWLKQEFQSAHQQRKARAILSGVFSTAIRRGWCTQNPIAAVKQPRVIENQIPILTPNEISRLLVSARKYKGGSCLAAVGLMLYAGIRPNEVQRLQWKDIDFAHKAVCIMPRHSKTGGARRVSIHKPLLQILQMSQKTPISRICPANWQQHWRALRQEAGWIGNHTWPQDALRHTFASYHLQHFRSFSELQYELGHRDSSLLRSRYINMSGVDNTAAFWKAAF